MVAQRIIYEGAMKKGGVLKIDVNEEMIEYVHRSNGEYKAALTAERSRQAEGEKRRPERKRLNTELEQAITANKKASENLNSVISHHESNIHVLEEKRYATWT